MNDELKLRYNPKYLPGDILCIDGYSRVGMVMATKECGVIDEILEGKKFLYYSVLFFDDKEGFVYGEYDELYLDRTAKKVNHINFGEMVYEMRDIAEVYRENIELKLLVNSLR